MILCICPNPSIDTYAWIDSITAGKVNRIKKEQRFPGGKGVHAALAVAELGEEVHLLAFWGGPTGKWIRKNCEKYGVICHGPEIADWSRTCFTFKSENTIDETEILGCGPSVNSNDLKKLKQVFQKLLSKADCVSMSGSWPNGTGNTESPTSLEKLQLSSSTFSRTIFYPCLRTPVKKNPNLVTSWDLGFSHLRLFKIAGVHRLYCHPGFCVTFGFPSISLRGMGKT